MKEIIASYLRILYKRNLSLGKWPLVRTLVCLAVAKRIYPNKKNVKVPLGRFVVYGPDYETLSQLIKEKFADQEYFFQCSHLTPVIVDCGAHVGISMLYFKSIYPDAVIHCFEPSAEMFVLLEKNVRENNLGNVYLYNVALGEVENTAELYLPISGKYINATLHKTENSKRSQPVRVIQLSRVLKEIGHADLVKMDMEGSEIDVMEDLRLSGVLSNSSVTQFIVEYHAATFGQSYNVDDFSELLVTAGYHVTMKKIFLDYLVTARQIEE